MTHPVAVEHEYEPIPGLPGHLPEGERIVWQGRPVSRSVARHVMKNRWLASYFVILALWALAAGLHDGRGLASVLFAMAFLGILGAILLGLCELYAWGVQKTTLYTITNRRVVMRIGVALSMTLNIPFRQIEAANRVDFADGTGTLTLLLKREQRFAWMILWPHLRPWRFARPEPALRCIPDAEAATQALLEYLPRHAQGEAPATDAHAAPMHPDLVAG